MKSVDNILLFQAFGEIYREQAMYSVITLLDLYKTENLPFKIKIVTDDTEAFSKFALNYPIEAIFISTAKLTEWEGPDKFIHRRKINAIREVQLLYTANVLFVDPDTIFLKKVDELFTQIQGGNFLMHKKEYLLSFSRQHLRAEFFPDDIKVNLNSGLTFSLTGTTVMWNAGVVGISYEKRDILAPVLELTDCLYKMNPSFLIEQFAFSIILNQQGGLLKADKEIYHYCHQKPLANKYVVALLSKNKSLPEMFRKVKRDKLYYMLVLKTRKVALYYTGRRNLHRILRLLKMDFILSGK